MDIEINLEHPLAQAILNAPRGEMWLLLKTPSTTPYQSYQSSFRAGVEKYSVRKQEAGPDILYVEFESWEAHVERKAQLAGL